MGWFFLILISIIVIHAIASFPARRRVFCGSQLTPGAARDFCDEKFSKIMWKRVAGEGDLNFRQRGASFRGSHPPTIAIAIESREGGGSAVQLWMSEWTSRFGIVDGGPMMAWKLWSLAKGLGDAPPSAAAMKPIADASVPFPKQSSSGVSSGDGELLSPNGNGPSTSFEVPSNPSRDPFEEHRESRS